jgi:hypothetical protein
MKERLAYSFTPGAKSSADLVALIGGGLKAQVSEGEHVKR